MRRTLYGKLVLALCVLLSLLALAVYGASVYVMPRFMQELNQRLHFALAGQLLHAQILDPDRQVNRTVLARVIDDLMLVNPAIELYVLDTEGGLLAYSAPPGKIKRSRVDLAPIRHFIATDQPLPILGDDPRDQTGHKVFSAAPLNGPQGVHGYLYVVLGGEQYESIRGMLQQSFSARLAWIAFAVIILISALAGVLLFNLSTRRLRRLAVDIDSLKQTNFTQPLPALPDAHPLRDEIDLLRHTLTEMSQRIVVQVDQLRHADNTRREMVANISHDLRTPLSTLQGYLETLALKLGQAPLHEQRRYVETALAHSHRLGRLIADLFELATLEARDDQLHCEAFSLPELVQDVAQKYRLRCDESGVRMVTQVPERAPMVHADIGLIERVFDNLLDNALRYTPRGGSIALAVSTQEQALAIEVADSGTGIAPAALPHIFERFFRVDKSRQSCEDGTGLGLAIVQRIVQLHGSTISVDSDEGVGTRFRFALPVFNQAHAAHTAAPSR